MFLTPYETTGLQNHDLTKIKSKVEQELVRNRSSFIPMDSSIPYANEHVLTLNNLDLTDVPLFSQPLVVNNDPITNLPENNKVVIDCRSFISNNRGNLSIAKPASYKNHLIGACLTHYWMQGGISRLNNLNKFPTKVYSNWFANNVSRKLNIDEISQVKTNVIVAYFFLCLFQDYPEYTQRQLLDIDDSYTLSVKIAGASGLKNSDVVDIINQIPTMKTINDLCSALKQHGGSNRFKAVNTPLVYSLLGKSGMYGVTPETVIASLEYPPLFMALVYICAMDRGYQKSGIGQLVHAWRNQNDVGHFTKEIRSILNNEY